jgi:hypothetical protein
LFSPALPSLLLLHRFHFALKRCLQLVHRFVEVIGRGDGEGVITLLVMIVDRKLDLPVFSLLWLNDKLCHSYSEYLISYRFSYQFSPDYILTVSHTLRFFQSQGEGKTSPGKFLYGKAGRSGQPGDRAAGLEMRIPNGFISKQEISRLFVFQRSSVMPLTGWGFHPARSK